VKPRHAYSLPGVKDKDCASAIGQRTNCRLQIHLFADTVATASRIKIIDIQAVTKGFCLRR